MEERVMSTSAVLTQHVRVPSASLVPDHPIDHDQLSAVGQGDRKTMQELLRLFDLQTDLLMTRMSTEAPRDAAAFAHTLAINAHAVGAWKVAECAREFERLANGRQPIVLTSAMNRLSLAVVDVHAAIESFLHG